MWLVIMKNSCQRKDRDQNLSQGPTPSYPPALDLELSVLMELFNPRASFHQHTDIISVHQVHCYL